MRRIFSSTLGTLSPAPDVSTSTPGNAPIKPANPFAGSVYMIVGMNAFDHRILGWPCTSWSCVFDSLVIGHCRVNCSGLHVVTKNLCPSMCITSE